VRSVLPQTRPLALHEPTFAGREWDYVKSCIDSGWVSSVGSFVDRFERTLEDICGVRHAVAAGNGTAALHICFILAGVSRDDEVIVPALTFVGTVNAIAYCGAVPHFADVEPGTLGLDPDRLAQYLSQIADRDGSITRNRSTGRVIRACCVMHTFGHPSRMKRLAEVCAEFGLALVEDAAEGIGSSIDGAHVGATGLVASLSFNGNKTITTGGGGAILTNDPELGKRAKHLTTTARVPAGYEFLHDEVGYNYRMPNLNAALGCAQLEQLPGFLAAKRQLADRYTQALADVDGVTFVREPPGTSSNYWLCALLFDNGADRDRFLTLSNADGLQTRPPWRPMHRLPMYETSPQMPLRVTEDLTARLVNIPSSPGLAA